MDEKEKEFFKTEIFGRIFALNNALQYYLDGMLKEDGLTVKQMFTMLAIDRFEDQEPSLKDIAKLLQSSHQNVKQLINKLETNGYVVVKKDEHDKRVLRISLTKKANDYWLSHSKDHADRLNQLFQGFEDNEYVGMLNGIDKITDNLEKGEGE